MSKKYLVLYETSEGEWHNEFDTLQAVVQDLKIYKNTVGVVYKRFPIEQKRKSNKDPLGVFIVKLEEK